MATLSEWPPRPHGANDAGYAPIEASPIAPAPPVVALAPVVDTQPSLRFVEVARALDEDDDINLPFAGSARRTWQLAIAMGVLSLVLATLVAFAR
jgi:hypothetical protein